MKKWLLGALMAISLVSNESVVAATQTSVNYKTYTNSMYGFAVQYPSSWKQGVKPTNSDGESFYTPSGVASFTAVANENVIYGVAINQDFAQMTTAIEKRVSVDKKRPSVVSESVKIVPNAWVVVTQEQKVGKNSLQYSKQYFSLYLVKNLSLTYPVSQIKQYTPILNHIVASFIPGELRQTPSVPVTIDKNNGNEKLCEAIKDYLVRVSDSRLFKSFTIVKVAKDHKSPLRSMEWSVTLIVHHQPGMNSGYQEGRNERIVGFTQKNGSYEVNSLATGG